MRYAIAMVLNCAIFAYGGYLLGNYQGSNTPWVNKAEIEQALFLAMMEE